jgi:hypothetical protein
MTSLERAMMYFGWVMAVPTLFLLVVFLFAYLMAWRNVLRGLRGGVCRVCGCTDGDCRGCILLTGEPCSWIDKKRTLCSACVDHLDAADVSLVRADLLPPDCPSLNARRRG